jgi:hypothetical protein
MRKLGLAVALLALAGAGCENQTVELRCNQASECPGADTECREPICEQGVCGFSDKPEGTALASQVAGDCKREVCDGNGGTASSVDPSDVYDDGNPCTEDLCEGGAP